MNKEKWYSIGYLGLSILFLLIVLGTAAWHFFHDHHDDTSQGSSAGAEPAPHAVTVHNNDRTKTRNEAAG